MRQLRILMVSGVFYPKINGSVVAVSNMMRALTLRKNKVVLVTRRETGTPRREIWNGVLVVRAGRAGFDLGSRAFLAASQLIAMLKEAKEYKPDVIHAHGFTSLFSAWVAGLLLRRPVIVSFHGVQRLWSSNARWRGGVTLQAIFPLERFLLSRASLVLAQSKILASTVAPLYGVPMEKFLVVPNPIDVESFAYEPPREDGSKVVLFVGSLMKVHGPDLLIEAVPDILKSHPDARFVLVGKGPLKDRILKRINELGLDQKVDLRGEIRDTEGLSAAYRESRVVVLPLRYTGYILSLVGEEALSSGRPVVTTMTLDDELSNAGVKASARGNTLAALVSNVLGLGSSEYLKVSRSARAYAEDNFSLESSGSKLAGAYALTLTHRDS